MHRIRLAPVLAFLLLAFWCGSQVARAQSRTQPRSQKTPTAPSPSPKEGETKVQEGEVVRVDTDLVSVFFTAVDKNRRFITTLAQQDIHVTEDGVPQEIFSFQRETDRPLSIAILIDVSASEERTLPAEKAAAQSFINTVIRPKKDQVAVISFTGEATLEQGMTDNVASLQRAIDHVEVVFPPGYIGGGVVVRSMPPIFDPDSRAGSTAIWDAVWVTSEELLSESSEKARRTIILLTDGVDTSSRLKRSEAIERAVKAGTVVYSVGIGDSRFEGVDKDTLRKLSERTGGRAFFPRDEADLHAAFTQIEQELRSQYLIAYSPANKKKDGSYRQVKIDIANPELRKEKLQLTYRQGYFANGNAAASLAK
jgi:VWFA-related protein